MGVIRGYIHWARNKYSFIPRRSFWSDIIRTWIIHNRRLKTLCRTKVKLQAHLNFVSTCLDLDVIPRGLVIQKTPIVPEVGDVKRLSSIWESTLQKTSHILLKHRKRYYRKTLLATNSKLRQEESKLRGRTNFEDSIIVINHHTDKIFWQVEERKCRKVKRLEKKKKGKRICRKTNLPSPSKNHGGQRTNTVVNLSKMPLLEDETSPFFKGPSFCPKPRRFNTIQLKQDFKDFTQRLRLRDYFLIHWMRTVTHTEKNVVLFWCLLVCWSSAISAAY